MILASQCGVPIHTFWRDAKPENEQAVVKECIQAASARFSKEHVIPDDDVVCTHWVVRFGKRMRIDVACGPDLTGLGRLKVVRAVFLESEPEAATPLQARGLGAVALGVLRGRSGG